ncbi:ShlB/FhaC/HecB family hemolysin secretion/activation protein [Nostoc sp. UCD121]|uniref:ShlB/FhaC/HecB family hemolysin secretion/activation protein n=1 Tax=unclassified Nostoc TaxID=2593658 RepID=UPI00162427ED|nr:MULTISPECIES: ShlB/FhaC/HecB family hemolysin secretion/activation protein [unclassified Nostoc]MBC1224219.1 ShlB/FhaC/HecB family hemolysin secretion/activation protein [Nostoc sp. UCD120]MBC1278534.1 ShlB/FhaC/HecB family hemolysin secretion/activation protein [Nostoc sp. UCD121]MBC1299271.1 ShlB/FhaC/HecB family hemolysin secretion/activation protein [Nostoc sp. UCD122]
MNKDSVCWSVVNVLSWWKLTLPSAMAVAWLLPSYAASSSPTAIPSIRPTADTVEIAQNQPAPTVNPRPDPNRDRFPQPLPDPTPLPEQKEPILTPPTPETQPSQPNVLILVRKVEVVGSTIFAPQEINPIVQPLEGRSVNLEELQKAADAITQLYLNKGYITSRAVLVNQVITDGVVQIRVIEGRLEKIQIEGTRRLNRDYVSSRVRLGIGKPLNSNKLEEQLRLLRIDPLFDKIDASLSAGSNLGESILTIRVDEAKSFESVFSVDNYSPPSIAPEKAGVFLRYRNLTGIGDEITASYNFGVNFDDFDRAASNVYDFTYRVPLNPMNGTVQFRAAPNNNKLINPAPIQPFGDIKGSLDFYEISYRQPLVRSLKEEFALSTAIAFQGSSGSFTFDGIGVNTEPSRTRVLKFGQDYTRRDTQGAWAIQSQFSFGLDIFDATVSSEPNQNGSFFSWLGQVQRVQQLGNDNLLIVQADIQLTPDDVPPFYEFFIGGGQSLRGYRQNARSGDNGYRLSVEGRIPILRNGERVPILQLAPFVDLGQVWNKTGNVNNPFLASAGLGLLWQPIRNFNIRVDYGIPFVEIEKPSGSLQDDGLHFSLTYSP